MKIRLGNFQKTITSILLILLLFFGIYIGVTYLLSFFAPFIIAIIICAINEPVISFLQKTFRLKRKTASVLSLLLTVSIIAVLIFLAVLKTYYELIKLQNNLPYYIETVSNTFNGYYDWASVFYHNLPDNISEGFEANFKEILPRIEKLITSIASSILNSITSIPKIAVFSTVTLLSSYFISSDRNTIGKFIYRQLPIKARKDYYGIKHKTITGIIGYFRAQLILISITFIEATLGFLVIKADYAVLMGLVVALSDAIPILGTNIVMIPWIIWNVAAGNMKMALGLTAVYILGIIIRQIVEPKIVAHQTGLHPFITLISMYTGYIVFGFLGLFIGPVLMVFLKNLQSSGIIHIWNE